MVKVGWSILCWGWGKLMLSGSVSINFYLINKYGIIREEILCIIHVFTIRSIQQIWFNISTYTHWLNSWFYYQIFLMILKKESLMKQREKNCWCVATRSVSAAGVTQVTRHSWLLLRRLSDILTNQEVKKSNLKFILYLQNLYINIWICFCKGIRKAGRWY